VSTAPIVRTFQLSKGVGPWREKDLWARGILTWDDFEAAAGKGTVMSKRLDVETLERISQAREALRQGDLAKLAGWIPAREHWRLYPRFAQQAAFFDLEADGENQITVGGVMDRDGVATFIRGKSLQQLPKRLGQSAIWVTFNGAVFDVPVLKHHFEDLPRPLVHLDLKVVLRKTRQTGGLKDIEERLGLGRPPHLKGVRGMDAIRLWREFNFSKDPAALRFLVEYNLYDAINLRTLLDWSVNEISLTNVWNLDPLPVFGRGDVLYDLSRLLLAL
jgi:uncharacterized protein YprB with RNaseH-like and TPR domain